MSRYIFISFLLCFQLSASIDEFKVKLKAKLDDKVVTAKIMIYNPTRDRYGRRVERYEENFIKNIIVKVNDKIVYHFIASDSILISRRVLKFKFKEIWGGDTMKLIIKTSNGNTITQSYPIRIDRHTKSLWKKKSNHE